MAEKPIRGLSKGMKQRLCLGRTLIHDPTVLILDEPAAGLDPRARIELRQMIGELAAQGKTLLVSSHILTELAEMCDHVGIIERGQLLATGKVSDFQRAQQTTRQLVLRIVGDASAAASYLATRDDVERPVVDGQLVRLELNGELEQQAALLRELVLAGHQVAELNAHVQSLEDVFLQVTEGLVQ
jgi:ABC-2 type transport system ATP-binding protein